MKKRILFLMFVFLCMMILLHPSVESAAENADSGVCGDNLIWTLDDEGTLVISGTGEMYSDNIISWQGRKNEIRTVIIENGVTSIRKYAFYDCSSLKNITISGSVTSVGEYAFADCRSLSSITIPESVMSIGRCAFVDCDGLTSVTIPEGVTSIGTQAFFSCDGLTSVTIFGGVTSIGDNAFGGCSRLMSVTILKGVTSIGREAFSYCRELTSVTIPDSVTSIGRSAFANCNALTSVAIPDSVMSIGENAFAYCSGLTSITIPKRVTSIEYGTFFGCDGLTSVTISEGVTSIGESAFIYCSGLTSVIIPDSVTNIGSSAFHRCSRLTSVTIPEGVMSIEGGAFGECGLMSVIIPDSVTSIGGGAFTYCRSLTSITIPKGVTSIESNTFSGCIGLTSVTIPKGVTSIGENAFAYCGGLTSIKVEEGNPKYDSRDNCNAIIETESNTLIRGCKNTIIPEEVTSIGSYAFSGCNGPMSVTIPEGVTNIGSYAFSGCSGLTSVIIPEGVTSIGYNVFSDCNRLTSVTIPEGVTSIGGSAFGGCSGLTSVTIPKGVTSIEYGTFSDCSGLTSVTIPKGVTSIGNWAFSDCKSLTDVYYSGSENDWVSIVIGDGNSCLNNVAIHYNDDKNNGSGENSSGSSSGINTSITKRQITYYSGLGGKSSDMQTDWGWGLFEQPSMEYDCRLGTAGAILSNAAEYSDDSHEYVEDVLGDLGFSVRSSKNYKGDSVAYPGVSFGYRHLSAGGEERHIFAIVLRGTKSFMDGVTDAASVFGAFGWSGDNINTQFHDFIKEECSLDADAIKNGDTKIFVTGHSLGGATANILAAKLNQTYGISSVYAYTFAAPRAIDTVSDAGRITKNIFNVMNVEDSVPVWMSTQETWYGVECWFDRKDCSGINEAFKNLNGKDLSYVLDTVGFRLNPFYMTLQGPGGQYSHSMDTYMAFMLTGGKNLRTEDFISGGGAGKGVLGGGVWCPVDFEIYLETEDGRELVGRIVDNEIDYEIDNIGVGLRVVGDKKYFYFLCDGNYIIKLTGTNSGTMRFFVQEMDCSTGAPIEGTGRDFKNVKLISGKQFISEVKIKNSSGSDGDSTEDMGVSKFQLFVMDDSGAAVKEVLADGSGTEVTLDENPEKPENSKEPDTGSKTENPVSPKPNKKDSPIKVNGIKISGISKKIAAGKKITLKAAVSPSNAANKSLAWKSGNKKYATVNGKGVVTLKKAGAGKTVTITASAKDGSGKKASYKIKIMKGIVKDVKISGKAARTVKSGTSLKLKASVKASNGANKALQWKSGNTKYASVNGKGKVTLKKAGKGKTVKITAMATDGSGRKAVVKIKIK